MITICPVCKCQIIMPSGSTLSHPSYVECLEALADELTQKYTELFSIQKREMFVMRLEIKRRHELQEDLNKAYELKE